MSSLPSKSLTNASKPVLRLASLLTSTLLAVNQVTGLEGKRGDTGNA